MSGDPASLGESAGSPLAGDTIVAVSSAPGPSLRGIVRLSGPESVRLARERLVAEPPPESWRGGRVFTANVRFGRGARVAAEIVVFRGPASYTREDVVEIHATGSPVVLRAIVEELRAAGARLAEPGEFTRRAFLAGRVDLAQVESVLAMIRASNRAEAAGAARAYRGGFGRDVRELREALLGVASRIEAHLDFSDQDIELVEPAAVTAELRALADGVRRLAVGGAPETGAGGVPTVALVGAPNAGKSSLFNALLGRGRSLVATVAGTTLDAVEAEGVVELASGGDMVARFVDCPGFEPVRSAGTPAPGGNAATQPREPADGSVRDRAEARARAHDEAGVRAREVARDADVVLLVVDRSRPLPPHARERFAELPSSTPIVVASNQIDRPRAIGAPEMDGLVDGALVVETSARTGEGLEALRAAIAGALSRSGVAEIADRPMPNERQAVALAEALDALDRAVGAAALPLEIVAVEVHDAARRLGRITGEDLTEGLLDRIFSDFCIGK